MSLTLQQAKLSGVAPWDDLVGTIGDVTVNADRFPVTEGHQLFVPSSDTEQGVAECFRQAY